MKITGTRSTEPTPNQVAERTDGTTTVRGVTLGWTSEGDGPLTVWVHGMTNDRWALEDAGLYDWSPVVASGRRLLRYDARGHGRSEGRTVASDYTWPNFAEDLLALLDAVSPGRPVTAMGSSTGTATLLLAALRAPERFDRLVLTAPPTAWGTRANQAQLYRRGAEMARRDGGAAFERLTSAQPRQGLFRDLPNYPPRLTVADELLPYVLEGGAENDLPDPEVISALTVPTLVLSWEDDPVHPVATGRRLAEVVPGARFAVAGTVAELRTWGRRAAEFLAGG